MTTNPHEAQNPGVSEEGLEPDVHAEEREVAKTTLRKLFRAAADLKAELSLDESSFRGIAPEAHPNSRDFFIFEALDEVQKMASTMLPLVGAFGGPDDPNVPPGDEANRIIKEGLTDQAALWQRKLNEFLADLVAFRTTNEVGFFRSVWKAPDGTSDPRQIA